MGFNLVVKLAHLCNLLCDYCDNADIRRPMMSGEVLERTIFQAFAYPRARLGGTALSFIWA
ncbi:MAG: hypothetical protein ACXWZ2_14050, partial [Mycobacterium sp.]